MTKNIHILLALLLPLFSCKKAEDRSCFKSIGAETQKDVPVAGFNELFLGHNMNYSLVEDTIPFVRLTGGENLLNLIDFDAQDSILSITNKNRCNFLRKYDRLVHAEIHFTKLQRIDYKGSHDLIGLDTIRGAFFNLRLAQASGNVNLLVNTDFLNGFVNDGSGDYTFKGYTKFAHIQAYSNGFADARELLVENKLEVTSRSTRSVMCHAEGIQLKVTINGTGNVYYSGTPVSIELERTSSGNLLPLN